MKDAAPQNKNRRRAIIRAAVLFLLVLPAAFALWLKLTWVDAARLPALRDGDIVFNTSSSRQSLAIGIATRSWLTHVGFVRMTDGAPFVIESSSAVREIPFDEWLETGVAGRLLVMRRADLTPEQIATATRWSRRHFGKPYDIFFAPGHDAFYCSELVGDAFRAAGVKLGTVQKLGDLHLTSSPVRNLIGERWARHPRCKEGQARDAQECLGIIGALDILTPVSIAQDPALEEIYSNYLF